MIVPMKKVLLVTLSSDRDASLEKLRELGVLEVVSETLADSSDRAGLVARLAALDRALGALGSRKVKNVPDNANLPEKGAVLADFTAEEMSHLAGVTQRHTGPINETAMLDCVHIILEEYQKRQVQTDDDLLALRKKFMEKKGVQS